MSVAAAPTYSRSPTAADFALLDARVPHWEERRIFPQPLVFLATLLRHPDGATVPQIAREMARTPDALQDNPHAIHALAWRLRKQISDLYTLRTVGKRGRPGNKYVLEPRMVGEAAG